jgi:ABC-type polysaccharide/polyol phosphate transport system, ATPase component
MNSQTKIIINNVSKVFKIGFKKRQSILEKFVSLFSGREPKKDFLALKDVSFKVNSGEILGIIGDNGSGKSTLLRIISGIYKQKSGEVLVEGKIVSLIGLIAGFKERLTMKDNIYLCCSLFGLKKGEIKSKFEKIIEFSELGDFINTKMYQFSLGMVQRLAFSIAINCNPDILLLDEAFESGDEHFRTKSRNKIINMAASGCAVVLVSHDLEIMNKNCSSVIWMENGVINMAGSVNEVMEKYIKEKDKK